MTPEEKESAYYLQKIDCNCNNCHWMIRDLDKYKMWSDWHREQALMAFERAKAKAFEIAYATENEHARKSLLFLANKMTFQFERPVINYGHCALVTPNKPISFIPGICQLGTQKCFVHRKEIK